MTNDKLPIPSVDETIERMMATLNNPNATVPIEEVVRILVITSDEAYKLNTEISEGDLSPDSTKLAHTMGKASAMKELVNRLQNLIDKVDTQ